jgi:hypothetical protein
MRIAVTFPTVLVACIGLFFFAHHHRPTGDPFRSCTLAGIYRQLYEEKPDIVNASVVLFLLLGLIGIATAFYPAAFVVLASCLPAGKAGGPLFVLAGLLAIIGAFANFLVIIVSHVSFGFGTVGSERLETPFFWIIPVFQLAFAAASLVIGCSAAIAGWMNRVLSL